MAPPGAYLAGVRRFKTEEGVRAWLKREADRVWWVENKRGGTFGFPDSVAWAGGALMFLELKLSEGGVFKAAPAQINVLRQLNEANQPAWIVGGVKNTDEMWVASFDGVARIGSSKGIGNRVPYMVERVKVEADSSSMMSSLVKLVSCVKNVGPMKTTT